MVNMKTKLTITILSFALLAVTACNKTKVDPQGSFLTAQKGAAEWISKTQEANTYQDSIYLFGTVGEERLQMHIKFTGKGKYILTGKQATYMVTVGGDVSLVDYMEDAAAESVLNVTDYNADTRTITGNFSLNMDRDYHYANFDTYYPQKLAFTKGTFKITLAK